MKALRTEIMEKLGVIPIAANPDATLSRMIVSRAIEEERLTPADYLLMRDLILLSGASPAPPPLHLLLIVMLTKLCDGSVCVDVAGEVFRTRSRELCGDCPEIVLGSMLSTLAGAAENYPALVSRDTQSFFPIIQDGSRLYFQKYHDAETRLRRAIRNRLTDLDRERIDSTAVDAVLHDILVACPLRRDDSITVLDGYQTEALKRALSRNLTIVSGGPGSGKTSIVVSVLRGLVRCGIDADRIRLVAPTGRAAQRIQESIRIALESIGTGMPRCDLDVARIEATTAHRLLRYNPRDNRFRHDRSALLPVDYIIVDEVSMLDVLIAAQLLEAIPPDAGLLMLGDPDQLPSVEAGAVLSNLLPDEQEQSAGPVICLQKSYRAGHGLMEAAMAVNRGDLDALDDPELFRPLAGGRRKHGLMIESPIKEGIGEVSGCHVLYVSSVDMARVAREAGMAWIEGMVIGNGSGAEWPAFVEQIGRMDLGARSIDTASQKLLDSLFDRMEATRILTVHRRGKTGCDALNGAIMRRFHSIIDPGSPPELFSGMPIIVTRNAPRLSVYNGDVGVCLRDAGGSFHFVFRRMRGYMRYHADRIRDWAPAFAMTVHKSQGSEYDRVLVVLPDDETSRILTREIIYTGLTRARRAAVILGSRAALARAVSRRIERESGPGFYRGVSEGDR